METGPGHEGSAEASLLQGQSEEQQPHPSLLNPNPNFNKVPEDADEVSKNNIRSLAFLLQAIGVMDGCKVLCFAMYNVHPRFRAHYTWDYYSPRHVIIIPMYNVQPYFSLKHLGKKCALYTAKYGKGVRRLCKDLRHRSQPRGKREDFPWEVA